jgi:hypothetical protein
MKAISGSESVGIVDAVRDELTERVIPPMVDTLAVEDAAVMVPSV